MSYSKVSVLTVAPFVYTRTNVIDFSIGLDFLYGDSVICEGARLAHDFKYDCSRHCKGSVVLRYALKCCR